MARAKNTSRSEARRRTRELTRTEMAAEQEPEDGGEAIAATTEDVAPRRRGLLFKWPDVRTDVRSVPGMFRTRKLLWLPFILLLVGFVLAMGFGALPAQVQSWALLYFQYFFAPQALFTYFIGGFVATRASYIIGLMLGTLTGVLWSLVFVLNPSATSDVSTTGDTASTIGTIVLASMVLGTFAGGFAGWYRDFLRGMQTRSKERQAAREVELRQKRRDDRQDARRAAKGRPVS